MKSTYIGSGDIINLLAGINTKSQHKLLKRFVSDEIPHWNAKASPIDALRTGAIIEERYGLTLPLDYYPQVKSVCKELDVLKCSLDFAKMESGKVIDFEEVKSCSFTDFLKFEQFRNDETAGIEYIKKKYKANYNQVQQQLLCTALESCQIVFVAVYTYEDEVNYIRDIKPNEVIKFRITRDVTVINQIIERAKIFQSIKDYYSLKK